MLSLVHYVIQTCRQADRAEDLEEGKIIEREGERGEEFSANSLAIALLSPLSSASSPMLLLPAYLPTFLE